MVGLAPYRTRLVRTDAALAGWLARMVAADLRAAVVERGRASLFLSGGSTPSLYLPVIARAAIPWRRVAISQVDDRWVSPQHPASNRAMITKLLGPAVLGRASFHPLVTNHRTPAAGLAAAVRGLREIPWPPDVLLLGMGTDAHIASLFPGHPGLDARAPRLVAVASPPAPLDRISLSLPALTAARRVYLVITGRDKMAVLGGRARTEGGGMRPVHRFLAAARGSVRIACCAP